MRGTMFENHLPKHKVGVLLPLSIIDNAAYEFYRLAPPGVMQVMIPIGLAEFSPGDVERALLKPLAANLDKLMERGVNLVVQSGTPLPTLIGVAAHDRMIALMAKHTGQKLDRVEKDVERDFIMNAQQSKDYGIVDDIIYKHK